MPIKWLMFFFSTWAILVLFGIGVEQTFAKVIGTGEYVNIANTLMSFNILTEVSVAGLFTLWVPNTDWIAALGKALVFQFDFMTEGPLGWLGYWTFFVPLSISMIVAMLFGIRGSPSS